MTGNEEYVENSLLTTVFCTSILFEPIRHPALFQSLVQRVVQVAGMAETTDSERTSLFQFLVAARYRPGFNRPGGGGGQTGRWWGMRVDLFSLSMAYPSETMS